VASREAETEPASENPELKAAELYADRKFEKALPEAEEAVARPGRSSAGTTTTRSPPRSSSPTSPSLNKDPERARRSGRRLDRKLERLANPAIAEKVKVIRNEEYRETASPRRQEGLSPPLILLSTLDRPPARTRAVAFPEFSRGRSPCASPSLVSGSS
jgi:hypothetical protein